jgi:hypothetical protein
MRRTEKHQFEHRAGKSTWCDDGRTRCAFLLSFLALRNGLRSEFQSMASLNFLA